MSSKAAAAPRDFREEVLAFLALLSSSEIQNRELQRIAPEERPGELCRLWFDEVYVPSHCYRDSIKGDASEEAVAQFWSVFSADEKLQLERFHQFITLRVEMLPNGPHRFVALHESPAWRNISQDAKNTFELLSEPGLSIANCSEN